MRSRSSLGQNAFSSILKNNGLQNNSVKKEVRWGADENRTYDREEGGLSPEPVVRRAGVDPKEPQVALTRPVRSILKTAMPPKAEQEMLERIKIIRNQASQNAERAEEAAMQVRATSPKTPTTNQYRREAPVVKEQSLLENLTTQLTGVQKTTGEVMGGVAGSAQVVGQNIQSLFENFSPFGGPAKAEAPRVAGPNNKKANTESSQTQVQGPRPEGNSWGERVTSDKGGGGRGGRG